MLLNIAAMATLRKMARAENGTVEAIREWNRELTVPCRCDRGVVCAVREWNRELTVPSGK